MATQVKVRGINWASAQVRCWPCGDQFDARPIASALGKGEAGVEVFPEGDVFVADKSVNRVVLGPGARCVRVTSADSAVMHECGPFSDESSP